MAVHLLMAPRYALMEALITSVETPRPEKTVPDSVSRIFTLASPRASVPSVTAVMP